MAVDPLAVQTAAARYPVAPPPAAAKAAGAESAGNNDDMSFWDVLDIINPLHHIPVVGSIYRAVTGDEIKPAMQISGGILFGGVIGGVAAIANAVLQESSGKDLGGHVMAGLGFGGGAAAAPVQTAAAPAAAAQASQAQAQALQAQAQTAPLSLPVGASPVAAPSPAGLPPGGLPAGGLSGGMAAAARQQPQGLDPTMVMNSGHVPNKMPKRDAMLASAMPRGSHTSNSVTTERAGPPTPPIGAVPASAASTLHAAPAPTAGAPTAEAVTSQAAGVPRDAMAETMLRNLAKYQAEKRAQTHSIRTSG